MNVKKHPLDNYKRFLLNRSTTNTAFVELIENMIAGEDEAANFSFHKIMVHNWGYQNELLFDTLSEYFSAWFIPIQVTRQSDITTFYTSNLNLILRLTRLDFMLPFVQEFFDKQHIYVRDMFNIDVLFNDKTSLDLFDNHIALEDVMASIVSGRLSDKKELDLSNFCNDQELKEKGLCFYKLSLLANFKILMLRIGRDTKSLNLSNNELVQPPLDILNFFIKGDLTEINLSYNKISSISDLVRVSSKIEKLWVEGNPLCEDQELSMYVKQITIKFPRLTELDGIKLNKHGFDLPFHRNYVNNSTKYLKMLVEKFLTLYFSHYDTVPKRKNLEGFYDDKCWLSATNGFTDNEKLSMPSTHANIGRNILQESISRKVDTVKKFRQKNKIYKGKDICMTVLSQLPRTQHDPTTFTVDMISHDKIGMILIVDGIFKDVQTEAGPTVFRFRRTFVFKVFKLNATTTGYKISHEMLHISLPTPQQLASCFKLPIRNMNTFELINPEREECETLVKIFCHITQIKKEEAEIRLILQNWDLKKAITGLVSDINANNIKLEMFMEEDDFSDSSSLIDDEMVD